MYPRLLGFNLESCCMNVVYFVIAEGKLLQRYIQLQIGSGDNPLIKLPKRTARDICAGHSAFKANKIRWMEVMRLLFSGNARHWVRPLILLSVSMLIQNLSYHVVFLMLGNLINLNVFVEYQCTTNIIARKQFDKYTLQFSNVFIEETWSTSIFVILRGNTQFSHWFCLWIGHWIDV